MWKPCQMKHSMSNFNGWNAEVLVQQTHAFLRTQTGQCIKENEQTRRSKKGISPDNARTVGSRSLVPSGKIHYKWENPLFQWQFSIAILT